MLETTVFKRLNTKQWKTEVPESQEKEQVTPQWSSLLPWERFQAAALRGGIRAAPGRSPEWRTQNRESREMELQGFTGQRTREKKLHREEVLGTHRRFIRSIQQSTSNWHRVWGNYPRLQNGQSDSRGNNSTQHSTRPGRAPVPLDWKTPIHRPSVLLP